MKIDRINFTPANYELQNKNKLQTSSIKNSEMKQTDNLPMPTASQVLSFTGGYSLNLAETIKNLDKLASKKSDVYPPQIREWAGIILEEGNKAKETLIGIHKKFYESLKDCFSLDEVKKKFPEFKDVISANDVTAKEGSFVDDFHKGKLEYFDNDEDLSLQLLKLYWGEGFSINDLRKYADGKSLDHTLRKLNIPTVDRTYGHLLKLSDADYNERITREMKEKRLIAMDRKVQQESGEPVYIKRGPLSPEHKQHISEGLTRYYQNNPEAIYNLSERQRQFYAENPDRAVMMRRVTTKAWYIFGADRVKSAMSAFMKKAGIKTFDVSKLENPLEFTKEESSALKKFWAENDWAKKIFSKNMSYSWKKAKEEQNAIYEIRLAPKTFIRKMIDWADERGIELTEDDFIAHVSPAHPELNYKTPTVGKYTRAFVDEQSGRSTLMANTYFLALLNINREISKMDMSKVDKLTRNLCAEIKSVIKASLFQDPNLPLDMNQFRTLEANDLQQIYAALRMQCISEYNFKLNRMFENHMDKAYDYMIKNWQPGAPLRFSPYGMDLK